jgi:hypothetical protein
MVMAWLTSCMQIDGVKNPKVQSVFFHDMPIYKAAFCCGGDRVSTHTTSAYSLAESYNPAGSYNLAESHNEHALSKAVIFAVGA